MGQGKLYSGSDFLPQYSQAQPLSADRCHRCEHPDFGTIQSERRSFRCGGRGVGKGKAEDAAHNSGDVGVMLLAVRQDSPALAWLGLASGQLGISECAERDLAAWLARLDPAEILHDGSELPEPLRQSRAARTARPAWQFDSSLGERKLREQLQVATLAGFNAQDLGAAHAAAAALLSFAEHTQGRALAHVRTLSVERASDLLELPPATHRNLELVQTLRGEEAPTLLSLLDTCRTGMGSRLLRHWLTHPGRGRAPAIERHDAIAALIAQGFEPLREALRGVSDVERITSRTALRQVRPRELAGLRTTLAALPALRTVAPRGTPLLDRLHEVLAPDAALTLNGAGSPTFRLHDEGSPLNEVAVGSALLKPADFDLELLAAFEPAAFIATPVLKVLDGLHLPGPSWLGEAWALWDRNRRRTFFIYGGKWMAGFASPAGLADNALYGSSSNQSIVNASAAGEQGDLPRRPVRGDLPVPRRRRLGQAVPAEGAPVPVASPRRRIEEDAAGGEVELRVEAGVGEVERGHRRLSARLSRPRGPDGSRQACAFDSRALRQTPISSRRLDSISEGNDTSRGSGGGIRKSDGGMPRFCAIRATMPGWSWRRSARPPATGPWRPTTCGSPHCSRRMAWSSGPTLPTCSVRTARSLGGTITATFRASATQDAS